jgi:hypothetical protein
MCYFKSIECKIEQGVRVYTSVHLLVGRQSTIDKMKNDLLMRRTYNSIILILNELRKKNSDRYTHMRINIYQDFGWQRKSLSSSHLCSVAACSSIISNCLFEQQYLSFFILAKTIKRTLRKTEDELDLIICSFHENMFF